MLVARSMHDQWLSNAYVLGDAPGGTAVFVDSGAPLAPLLELVERERLTPTHLLRTHAHGDHVEHEDELCDRFGIPVVTGDLVTGGLDGPRDRASRATPTTGSRSSSTTRSASAATSSSRTPSVAARPMSSSTP